MYHVPYSESPSDEFRTPSGEWYATLRAIAFDSWLLWKHALPEDHYLWPALSQDVFSNVETLGRRIHNLHQLLPDYRRLSDTPFRVSRWWDPADPDGDWASGSRVLLRINGYTVREIEQEVPSRFKGQLHIQSCSVHWMEITLPEALQRCLPGVDGSP